MKKKPRQIQKFGEHLIFDAYGCSYKLLNNKELCEEVLNKIARVAKMNKLDEPRVIEASQNMTLGGKDPGGFSGFLIIQESHISIHTFAKRGFLTIDVYSCKEIDSFKIINYLVKVFNPKEYDVLKIDRGLKYPKDNIY
jgi:S-adenosylmethionine decarboxylase